MTGTRDARPDRATPLVDDYVRWVVEEQPTTATALGDRTRDADLPDVGPESLDRWERQLSELRAPVVSALAGAPARSDERGDLVQLLDAIEAELFSLSRDPWRRNPLTALGAATGGVFEHLRFGRGAQAAARARAVPAFLDAAAGLLTSSAEPHLAVARDRVAGAVALFTELVPDEDAAAAVRRYGARLDDLAAAPADDWRYGAGEHAVALRRSLGSLMPADEVWRRATDALAGHRDALVELATAEWRTFCGTASMPDDPDERCRAALAAIGADAASRSDLVSEGRAAVREARAFLEGADVIALPPAGQLDVDEVPAFQRGGAVAFFRSPPVFDPDARSTYYLSPIPVEWDAARAGSFLREYNRWGLRCVAVHEAYPGHFVQQVHARHHPRLARRLFLNGAFVEGWAVYAEQLVQEVGYDDPRFRLAELKMALRVTANALIDVGLQGRDMTDAEAMAFLTDSALQEETEARGKLVRAKLGAGQLSTYFVGGQEVLDLREDVRRARGSGFDLKSFHADVLSHGSPPVALLREVLL